MGVMAGNRKFLYNLGVGNLRRWSLEIPRVWGWGRSTLNS